MLKRTLFTMLFLEMISLPLFAGTQTMAWHLKVEGSKNISCTTTLIREQRGCRFLTNAHCFESNVSALSIHHPVDVSELPEAAKDYFAKPEGNRSYVTELKKIDPEMDLAELTVPRELKSSCSKLDVLDPTTNIEASIRHGQHDSFMSLGFHGGKVRAAFTRNTPWADWWKGNGGINRTSTSLKRVPYLYRLSLLQMLGGMSGGPTLGHDRKLAGINRRYVNFQEITEIIPLRDVMNFLAGNGDAEALRKFHNGEPIVVSGGGNSGDNGGENSGGHGGENSGGHGGENSGGHGGDSLLEHNGLSFLREPFEGTIIGGRRLLALGPYQIDGMDDYFKHKDKGLSAIYEDSNEFRTARAGLISRLEGKYGVSVRGWTESREKYLHMIDGKWEQILTGIFHPEISITKSNTCVEVLIRRGELLAHRDEGAFFEIPVAFKPETLVFYGTLNAEASAINLRNESGEVMTCQNRHYLKLICVGEQEELSLSLTGLEKGEMTYRHSRKKPVPFNGKNFEFIVYQYGLLMEDK